MTNAAWAAAPDREKNRGSRYADVAADKNVRAPGQLPAIFEPIDFSVPPCVRGLNVFFKQQ